MSLSYSPSVTCYERFGTAQEDYDEERGLMSAVVQLFCAYSDRHTLCGDLLRNHRSWPKGSATLVPLAYSASISTFDDVGTYDGQTLNPATAIVTVRYSTKRVELVTEELEPVLEAIKMDNRLFTWDDGDPLFNELGGPLLDTNGDPIFGDGSSLSEEEAPIFQRKSVNIVRNEMFVQPPLPNALFDFAGGCNNAQYTSGLLGKTFAPETLVYNPPVLHIKYSSTGEIQFDVCKRFTYVPWGANRFWRQRKAGYGQITVKGSGGQIYKPYPPVDFSQICAPQSPYVP